MATRTLKPVTKGDHAALQVDVADVVRFFVGHQGEASVGGDGDVRGKLKPVYGKVTTLLCRSIWPMLFLVGHQGEASVGGDGDAIGI